MENIYSIPHNGNLIDYENSYVQLLRIGSVVATLPVSENGMRQVFSNLLEYTLYEAKVVIVYKKGTNMPVEIIMTDNRFIRTKSGSC